MKFFAGVLLGLLLTGPSITHQHPTEYNNYFVTISPVRPQAESWRDYPELDVEGHEGCVIELLGGAGGYWTAQDVIDILDASWSEWNGPCDMLEGRQ